MKEQEKKPLTKEEIEKVKKEALKRDSNKDKEVKK